MNIWQRTRRQGLTRVYFASRYSRREELVGYAADLTALGWEVQARWLAGEHQWGGAAAAAAKQYEVDGVTPPEAVRFAIDDWEDLTRADLMIHFPEDLRGVAHPTTGQLVSAARGGNHVEFGIALGRNIPVITVGFRQNVFHLLPQVTFFPTWAELLDAFQVPPPEAE